MISVISLWPQPFYESFRKHSCNTANECSDDCTPNQRPELFGTFILGLIKVPELNDGVPKRCRIQKREPSWPKDQLKSVGVKTWSTKLQDMNSLKENDPKQRNQSEGR